MRNLVIGIVLGAIATLALGAVTRDTRYQTAAAAGGQALFLVRTDMYTGAVEACVVWTAPPVKWYKSYNPANPTSQTVETLQPAPPHPHLLHL
jgi:hypothetical protein